MTNQGKVQWPIPARYFAAVLLLLGVLGLLVFIKPVFDTVALGFIIAFLLFSPINWASRRLSGKYGLAILLCYLLIIVLLVLFILGGLRFLVSGLQSLQQSIISSAATFQIPDPFPQTLTSSIKDAADSLAQVLSEIINGLGGLIGLVVVSLFFSALLMLNLRTARGTLANWIPEQQKNEVMHVLRNLDKVWVGYLTAQVIYGGVLAAGSWAEYALLGVPYPALMAIINGTLSLIPTVGGLIGSLVVAIPCLLLGSTVLTEMSPLEFTVLVFALNVVITQVTYNFFALPVVGKFVRLPVAAVLIGVLAGMAMGNILVAFLVVPILSTLTIIGGYLLAKVAGREAGLELESEMSKEPGFFSQMLAKGEPIAPLQSQNTSKMAPS